MKNKAYSLRNFLKLYANKANRFIFSHENQDESVSLPFVQYEMVFSAATPVTKSAQNSIKLSDEATLEKK